jgi:hypothetical protein
MSFLGTWLIPGTVLILAIQMLWVGLDGKTDQHRACPSGKSTRKASIAHEALWSWARPLSPPDHSQYSQLKKAKQALYKDVLKHSEFLLHVAREVQLARRVVVKIVVMIAVRILGRIHAADTLAKTTA